MHALVAKRYRRSGIRCEALETSSLKYAFSKALPEERDEMKRITIDSNLSQNVTRRNVANPLREI